MMELDRRTALAVLGLGVASSRLAAFQHHANKLAAGDDAYKLQFFSEEENKLLDRLAEMIVPADERSGGAHRAKVSHYIDLMAANSSSEVQTEWKARLAAFDAAGGAPFLELDPSQQASLLNRLAAKESAPESPAEKFFVDVKKATLFAYYSARIGLVEELGFQGNQALGEFPACTHGSGAHR